jgi:hypothetical protein
MRRLRIAVALTAIAAAALLPAVVLLLQLATTEDWYRAGTDSPSAFERRFAPLRDALRDQREVGYLAPDSNDSDALRAHFYMTRYVLAPVHVRDDTDASLIVADIGARGVPPELAVRRDFGNGLLLLERYGH